MFKLIPRFGGMLCMLLFIQPAFSQSDTAAIGPLLTKNQKAFGRAVALVWKDGKIIFQRDAGVEFNGKVQAPIAAASQWLTAATVMSFVDEGKLKLDDPVGKYIPVFNSYMKSYLTIRQCLMHSTGFEREKGLANKLSFGRKYETLEAQVNALAAKEISTNAGEEYFFGNYGPAIAARVIEIVGKKPFERLVQERITRPCKMRATNFNNNDGKSPNPGFGAVSTANDYINFLVMLLNGGTFEGKKVLSAEAIKELQRAQLGNTPVKYNPEQLAGYDIAMGNYVQERDAAGNAQTICSPSLGGTWPYVDFCRKYAAIIFVEDAKGEVKRDVAVQFKAIIDAWLGNCK
ncbi:beta-lactamase family protein [Pseudoflavitalea sp. G-6-1-2]|uniref:serine hydrolase domain-containing protein n=1 Tax=Pseudoflavitalea sp. G-6-1-2 TaxID=2728841 RepID=UPI00146EEA02|nr:serine hydrolase domain-containing protein [Pseudoflavitalea sp. G-6-1-2]NML21078.1 beta-lactamase family protein [Pseudoflavitalea sp. G-6-1-2]